VSGSAAETFVPLGLRGYHTRPSGEPPPRLYNQPKRFQPLALDALMLSRRLFSLALVSLLAGCSNNTPTPSNSGGAPAPAAKKERKIGVSLLTFKNPFFKVIADNIASEGEKHGYETIALSADEDAAKQSGQVKDFIAQRVSAIVISPCVAKAIVPVIQEANKAGIPVLTVDIPCREEGVDILSQIATDNFNGGEQAAEAMIEALGERGGKIAVLDFKQAESCILRVEGFKKVIAAHNEKAANKVEIVAELDGGGDKEKGLRAMDDALQSESDLRGVFAINDPAALGARAAIEKANKADSIVIIGFDGQPEGRQAIKEGKIYADPIQYPDKMGVEAVKAIVAFSKGEDVPREIKIPTTLYKKADAEKELK
jgi:ribose transport system substrate-binding protein